MPDPLPPHGLKVLVVEDETLVSFLVEDMLNELGCAQVWHAASVAEASAILRDRAPDIAVLDVNLGDHLCYPLAEELEVAGVPFLFVTGYGREGMPERWTSHEVVQKPYRMPTLAEALRRALAA